MSVPEAPAAIRVERGRPTAEELAALLAVLAVCGEDDTGGSGGPDTAPEGGRSAWAAPSRSVRLIHWHGPGAWRGSTFPR